MEHTHLPIAKPATRPVTCGICQEEGHYAKTCPKQANHEANQAALFKAGKIQGQVTCDVNIDGSRLKCSIALTNSVFALIQADLNAAEQDAIRLKVASATEKADKKRQAAEMEMQAIILERSKKRKAEELEDHARIEELKRRALFGDDTAPAAQQRQTQVDLNPEEAQAPRRFFGWF